MIKIYIIASEPLATDKEAYVIYSLHNFYL